MLPAEMASTTAKPSMILARNRTVGSLSDGKPVRFVNPTSGPRLHSENPDWESPAPDPVRKTRAEWIRLSKFRPHSPWVARPEGAFFAVLWRKRKRPRRRRG